MNQVKQMIFYSASEYNCLPITSLCNLHCNFCSHRQNPPGVETFTIPSLTLEEIEEVFQFLDPDKKIVIGESVTKIIEGEPFLHPQFLEIIQLLRKNFPKTYISITTNGTKLTEENIAFLQKLGRCELNVSLNSANPKMREILSGDPEPKNAISGIELLGKHRLSFHGSIVVMPHLTGWQDIAETIDFLVKNKAKTIRLFLPGFTKYAPKEWVCPPGLWKEIYLWGEEFKKKIDIPVLLEPPFLNNLKAVVEGVLPDYPTALDGIEKGDVIVKVSGMPIRSRVEAFRISYQMVNPRLEVIRGDMNFAFLIFKNDHSPSGLVMYYDLDPERFEEAFRGIKEQGSKRPLILTSSLAYPIVEEYIHEYWDNLMPEVLRVENNFFGGTISAGGLLVVEDMLRAIEKAITDKREKPDLITIPGEPFDQWGKDLLGVPYHKVEEVFGIKTILV